ncbi:MAG: heme biosynthesis HemY N-terminal domain-containing protein [Burkholderiaceae bacterium]
MRRIIGLILVISAAVGIALLLRFNTGNVAILWPPYRVDLSLNLAIVVLLVAFILMYFLVRAASQAYGLPTRVRRYRMAKRRERAHRALRDSLMAYFEGRFGRAERLAENARDEPALAGPAALLAARAAQAAHQSERRDRWLEAAADGDETRTATRVMSAEIALEDGRPGDALVAVEELDRARPGRRHALELRLRVHEQQKDWERVLEVVDELDAYDAIPEPRRRSLRVRAYRALFRTRSGDVAAVRDLWKRAGSPEREDDGVIEAAATAFADSGDQAQAARLAEGVLAQRLVPGLLALYGRLDDVPAQQRLRTAERWLDRHGDDPELLTLLGQLCSREQIWGKAEGFLRRAEAKGGSREARLALAELYEKLERPDDAAAVHRRIATDTPLLAGPPAH